MSFSNIETTIYPIGAILKPRKVTAAPVEALRISTLAISSSALLEHGKLDIVVENAAESIDDDVFDSTCALMMNDDDAEWGYIGLHTG
jgi:hypothetical protein